MKTTEFTALSVKNDGRHQCERSWSLTISCSWVLSSPDWCLQEAGSAHPFGSLALVLFCFDPSLKQSLKEPPRLSSETAQWILMKFYRKVIHHDYVDTYIYVAWRNTATIGALKGVANPTWVFFTCSHFASATDQGISLKLYRRLFIICRYTQRNIITFVTLISETIQLQGNTLKFIWSGGILFLSLCRISSCLTFWFGCVSYVEIVVWKCCVFVSISCPVLL